MPRAKTSWKVLTAVILGTFVMTADKSAAQSSPPSRQKIACDTSRTITLDLKGKRGRASGSDRDEAFRWAKRDCVKWALLYPDPPDTFERLNFQCQGCPEGFTGCDGFAHYARLGRIVYEPATAAAACAQEADGKWHCELTCTMKAAQVRRHCSGCAVTPCVQPPTPSGPGQ